jgi:hypothetical protein
MRGFPTIVASVADVIPSGVTALAPMMLVMTRARRRALPSSFFGTLYVEEEDVGKPSAPEAWS